MDKIKLPENHRRSLTSALVTVEQILTDLETALLHQTEGCCYEVKKDLNDEIIRINLEVLREARSRLCYLASKYEIRKYSQSLKKIVNAKKTRVWEVLMDMRPKKQKGFGEFPPELADEYTRDIDYLLSVTEQISV